MKKIILGLTLLASMSSFANDVNIVRQGCGTTIQCYQEGLDSILNKRSSINTVAVVGNHATVGSISDVKRRYLDVASASSDIVLDEVAATLELCESAVRSGELKNDINEQRTMNNCVQDKLRD